MNDFVQKLLWVAIPSAFAAGIALVPGSAIEIQFIAYGVLALIAMFGIWATNARKHRQEREEAQRVRDEEERQIMAGVRDLLEQNTIMTCRMAIYNDHFSIDEKLSAYITYRSQGQNHRTKKYMDEQVGGDVDEYIERHGITA